jgi:hypothetical protein
MCLCAGSPAGRNPGRVAKVSKVIERQSLDKNAKI